MALYYPLYILFFLKRRKYYIVNKQYAVYRINETSMTRNINHMQENELKAYDYIFKKLIKEEQLKCLQDQIDVLNSTIRKINLL